LLQQAVDRIRELERERDTLLEKLEAQETYCARSHVDESVHGRKSEAEVAVHDRTQLLARQYAQKLSREEATRLEIATQRVLQLIPRITAQDLDSLSDYVESAMDEVDAITSRDKARREAWKPAARSE
jgi:hypothetical protein